MTRFRHVVVVLSLFCIASRVNGQQPPAAGADRAAVLRAAKEVIQKARYCSFITLGEDGQPQARIVDPLGPDDDMTIWVATNAAPTSRWSGRPQPHTTRPRRRSTGRRNGRRSTRTSTAEGTSCSSR